MGSDKSDKMKIYKSEDMEEIEMKKLRLVFIGILTLAAILCGCGSSGDNAGSDKDIAVEQSAEDESSESSEEQKIVTEQETEDSGTDRLQIGEAVYFSGENNEGKYEYSMTLIGTECVSAQDSKWGEPYIVAIMNIENIKGARLTVDSHEFYAYADDYEVQAGATSSDGAYVTLSEGRKADVEYRIEVDPDTADSIEMEYCGAVFVIKDAENGIAGSEKASDADNGISDEEAQIFAFTGTWFDTMSERCNMEIHMDDEFYYVISIDWGSSAWDNTHWEFKGDYDASQNGIVYKDGSRYEEYYPEDGGEVQRTEVYSDGEGLIYMQDGKLYWKDAKEDFGADCVFEKQN